MKKCHYCDMFVGIDANYCSCCGKKQGVNSPRSDLNQLKRKGNRISKKQHAEILLDIWLKPQLTNERIEQMARDLNFEINNSKDFAKLFSILLVLNMWIIVTSHEFVMDDTNKRNDLLDIFHRLVYQRYFDKEDFGRWLKSLALTYESYNVAIEKEPHQPYSGVENLILKDLFGEFKPPSHLSGLLLLTDYIYQFRKGLDNTIALIINFVE